MTAAPSDLIPDTLVLPTDSDISALRFTLYRASHSARPLAARSGGLEVVGIVWSDSSITELTNQARSAQRFSVSERQFAERLADVNPEEKQMVALFHSHPGGYLSLSTDDKKSLWHQWYQANIYIPWMIIPHDTGDPFSFAFWWYDGFGDIRGEIIREESMRDKG